MVAMSQTLVAAMCSSRRLLKLDLQRRPFEMVEKLVEVGDAP